jgi:hypothetical protein
MKFWMYKHYKWGLYEVIWIARDSEDLSEKVVYKALYNSSDFWDNSLWVRSKKMFLEEVTVGWKQQQRFSYVWSKKYSNV